jgi:hypothetical protein
MLKNSLRNKRKLFKKIKFHKDLREHCQKQRIIIILNQKLRIRFHIIKDYTKQKIKGTIIMKMLNLKMHKFITKEISIIFKRQYLIRTQFNNQPIMWP